jgi:hypothetical protein
MEHGNGGTRLNDGATRSRSWVRLAALTLATFAVLLAAAAGVYVLAVQREGATPLPPRFGNFPRVRDVLAAQPPREPFAFAVLGDTKSLGTFERLAEELRRLPLDFAVLLGDCASEGTEAAHRYLRAESGEMLDMPFPVFYVVGNHDVSASGFTLARFEQTYGPTVFSFVHRGCQFLMLRTLTTPAANGDSLALLRTALAEPPGTYRRRFVFMHMPLPGLNPGIEGRHHVPSHAAELAALLRALKPDYVFAGDFHGYTSATVGPTRYLVTGGGGARLRDAPAGQFHHAMIVTVAADRVTERLLQVPASFDPEDAMERWAIERVYPWMRTHLAATVAAHAALLGALGVLAAAWRRALRTRRCT